MDPNETLRKIRELYSVIMDDECEDLGNTAHDLANHICALDLWISKGGFLPEGWTNENRD